MIDPIKKGVDTVEMLNLNDIVLIICLVAVVVWGIALMLMTDRNL